MTALATFDDYDYDVTDEDRETWDITDNGTPNDDLVGYTDDTAESNLDEAPDNINLLSLYYSQVGDIYQPPVKPKYPKNPTDKQLETYKEKIADYKTALRVSNDHNRNLGITIQQNSDPDRVAAARNELVQRFLTTAVKVAQPFAQKWGAELSDLIQEANLALLEATDTWDPERGVWFPVYAQRIIKQRLQRYINDNIRTIRIPKQIGYLRQRIDEATIQLIQELQTENPTPEQISQRTGIPVKHILTLNTLADTTSLQETQYLKDEGEDVELVDTLPQTKEPNPEEALIQKELMENLTVAVRSLTGKQQEVIALRFGLTGQPPKSQTETADYLNITRNAVKERERLALIRLRMPCYKIVPNGHPLASA